MCEHRNCDVNRAMARPASRGWERGGGGLRSRAINEDNESVARGLSVGLLKNFGSPCPSFDWYLPLSLRPTLPPLFLLFPFSTFQFFPSIFFFSFFSVTNTENYQEIGFFLILEFLKNFLKILLKILGGLTPFNVRTLIVGTVMIL